MQRLYPVGIHGEVGCTRRLALGSMRRHANGTSRLAHSLALMRHAPTVRVLPSHSLPLIRVRVGGRVGAACIARSLGYGGTESPSLTRAQTLSVEGV